MAIHQMTLEALENLDNGRINEAFNQALKRAALDCSDRPGESKPRRVVLQAELIPELDADGLCETVNVKFQVKDTFPTRKSKKYGMQLRRGGVIAFSDVSADGGAGLFDFAEENGDCDD